MRRNQLLQNRKRKREQILAQKRNLGFSSAPVLICVIPLRNDINIKNVVSVLTDVDETANIATSPNGIVHIGYATKDERTFLSLVK